MAVDCDVVVVGAGPIGLTTALLLRQQGHSVQILERHATRYPQPRAVGLFHQAVRAFSSIGVLDRMFESKALQSVREYVSDTCYFVDSEDQVLTQVDFNSPLSKSGTDFSYSLHQPTMEEELEKACQERGVLVRRSAELIHAVDTGDHVEVEIADVASNEREKITASFVVGCDGAKSAVRKAADIPFVEFAPAVSRWLVVDVIPTVPDAATKWKDFKVSKQILDPKRPRTSVPSTPNRRRFEFLVLPGESSELAVTDAYIWKLLALFDCGPDTACIERRTVYSIEGCWAETFSKGRLALADAKSLAWRLDYAIKNPRGIWPKLLQQYSDEQLVTTKSFVSAAKGIEMMLIVTDTVAAEQRNHMLKGQVAPHPDLERVGSPGMHFGDGKTSHNPASEPGTLFIHDKVEKNGKKDFLDNVAGEGWVLITSDAIDTDSLTPAIREEFSTWIGGRVVSFSGEDGYRDVSGRYMKWFRDSKAVAVLVRPDYYIYGTAESKDRIEDLVKSVLSAFSS